MKSYGYRFYKPTAKTIHPLMWRSDFLLLPCSGLFDKTGQVPTAFLIAGVQNSDLKGRSPAGFYVQSCLTGKSENLVAL